MTEAEYYEMTDRERDEWVEMCLLETFPDVEWDEMSEEQKYAVSNGCWIDHRDANTMMEVVAKMRKDYGFDAHNGFVLTRGGTKELTEDFYPYSEKWYCEFPLPRWEDAEADELYDAVYLAAGRAKGVIEC